LSIRCHLPLTRLTTLNESTVAETGAAAT